MSAKIRRLCLLLKMGKAFIIQHLALLLSNGKGTSDLVHQALALAHDLYDRNSEKDVEAMCVYRKYKGGKTFKPK